AGSMHFPTMARTPERKPGAVGAETGGETKLVALKTVEPGYPLRGQLTVSDGPGQPAQSARDIPARGEVWGDAALFDALDLKIGDTLLLGDASFRVARL